MRLQFFIQAGHTHRAAIHGRKHLDIGHRIEGVVLGDTPLYQVENEALGANGVIF